MPEFPLGDEFIDKWMENVEVSDEFSEEVTEAVQETREGSQLDEDTLVSALLSIAAERAGDNEAD